MTKAKGTQSGVKMARMTVLMVATLSLAGCSLGSFPSNTGGGEIGTSTQGAAIRGHINGGQNPISGAKVYLYAAGNSAAAHTYGTGSASLLTSAVLTNNTAATDASSNTGIGGKDGSNNYYVASDANGDFSISSDYSCPGAVTQGSVSYPSEVYLMVVGGNSGGGTNTSINL